MCSGVTQWIERPPGVGEVMGSIPPGNSDFFLSHARVMLTNSPRTIYQSSIMAPRLSGQNCKFLSFLCLLIPKIDLDTKETTQNVEVCPESLGAMLEYCYIERCLFTFHVSLLSSKSPSLFTCRYSR